MQKQKLGSEIFKLLMFFVLLSFMFVNNSRSRSNGSAGVMFNTVS
jgi:hypothetical protein